MSDRNANVPSAVLRNMYDHALSEKSEWERRVTALVALVERLQGRIDRTLAEIDSSLREYLSLFAPHGTMPVMGNSVRLDMNFIDAYLPRMAAFLDYHMRDVSTIAGLASDWYGLPWFEKAKSHRAMDDVLECIAELEYLRDVAFRPGVWTGTIGEQLTAPGGQPPSSSTGSET